MHELAIAQAVVDAVLERVPDATITCVRLDIGAARHAADLATISPHASVLPVSAATGDGLEAWHDWLRGRLPGGAAQQRPR